MGMVERAHTSDRSTSRFPLFPASASLLVPFISFFPLARHDPCYHSFSRHFSVSFPPPSPPSTFHSLVLRGNSLPPLPSLIHHHHPPFPSLSSLSLSLSHTHTHTHTHTVCTHIDMHKSSLHISVTASGQYRGLIAFRWVYVRGGEKEEMIHGTHYTLYIL